MATTTGVWGRVRDLARREPVTVPASACLSEVAETLWQQQVGLALVVADDGRVVGLVSERDLIGAMASGQEAKTTPVTDVMTAPIVAVAPGDSLYDAAVDMLDLGVRHVPVADEHGTFTGVVSIRDVLRPLLVQALGG